MDRRWSKMKKVQRLEGLVIQKRRAGIEQPRYLVIDLLNGSISLYKKPPPKQLDVLSSPSRSVKSKLVSSLKSSLIRSKSEEPATNEGGDASQISFEHLTHLSIEKRDVQRESWEPIFTVPFSVEWKLRDVENDETMFYLVLPPDLNTRDSDAEIGGLVEIGNCVSYRNLKTPTQAEEESGTASKDDGSECKKPSKPYMKSSIVRSMFQKSFASKPLKEEKIYTFRVMLDGNEKFIWLTAAAQLNRLADASAVFIISSTLSVPGLFKLPGSSNRKLIALRYAEWARIVDNNKSVSSIPFNPLDDISTIRSLSGDEIDNANVANYADTKLMKIRPSYAYKNRRMTLKELDLEMMQPSEKWEDFRNETVGDRDEPIIGAIHVEILSCYGLPKMDTFSLTDACCYMVCGPFAFATDVIDSAINPCWPCKSRRACIFPLYFCYQKLFVGVFDNDGASEKDDFAGRVVVDMSSLRPNSSYDVFLPLRRYQNTYIREPRGVIRLRMRLEWSDEQKALFSYLKLPKKVDKLGHAITINCYDQKAFRNVVLTVQGKDVPGKYNQLVQKGLQREMKLYKICLKNGMNEQMKDIVLWVHPMVSCCVFLAWMHCVYNNSVAYVPVYLLVAMNATLYSNYVTFVKSDAYNYGFHKPTIPELFRCMIIGGQNNIKPIHVASQNATTKMRNVNESDSELDLELTKPIEYMMQNSTLTARMDNDHLEFPFSEKGRYARKTLIEACADGQVALLDDANTNADEGVKSSALVYNMFGLKKKAQEILASRRDDDDEDDDGALGEFELMVCNSIQKPDGSATTPVKIKGSDEDERNEKPGPLFSENVTEEISQVPTISDTRKDTMKKNKLWKRSKDPLPEQDATIKVKSRKTLKQELAHNKDLLHKMTMRLFDDRMFIADTNQPCEELTLDAAIGMNKHKNPVVAKLAEFLAPALEMLKVGLSVFRAGFNLFTWRDPYLTFLFQMGSIILMLIFLVFPWRLFLGLVGVGFVGPQNFFVRIMLEKREKRKEDRADGQDTTQKKAKKYRNFFKSSKCTVDPATLEASMDHFRFHNHLHTSYGIDLREEKRKLGGCVYRAVVPNSPFISHRFYDWPPNPSLSSALVHAAANTETTSDTNGKID